MMIWGLQWQLYVWSLQGQSDWESVEQMLAPFEQGMLAAWPQTVQQPVDWLQGGAVSCSNAFSLA